MSSKGGNARLVIGMSEQFLAIQWWECTFCHASVGMHLFAIWTWFGMKCSYLQRKWLSSHSYLLWCSYPYKIVFLGYVWKLQISKENNFSPRFPGGSDPKIITFPATQTLWPWNLGYTFAIKRTDSIFTFLLCVECQNFILLSFN